MQQTFQINAARLNAKFISSVKALFGNKEVKIVIEEVQKTPEDKETVFKRLFGSWQGEESGEELARKIRSNHNDLPRNIDL